ncbi:helix-turn-helix domain-containing protein [Jeotgalibacillus haloalkalitolerans]|uniref:Helix-turn-helix domain-containing protein n=1 Tax=Jeotgalibacillus haloalkalitolerans TaxID=3104292 RepID=A0ABU5KNQ6_9BACL|nr:helix-turn-helix domain-containing protein [Jeotgalibacillus sp. HH7-29]MDZ5712787.1 helix-turn-helix domain-containing protein [Jeotgalibacillus sp. HH7-29]
MKRKMNKKELKAVRLILGLQQQEFADILGVSKGHLSRTESNGKDSYDVSDKLDELVKYKLNAMEINVVEILELAKKRGMLK